jgi:hypothetical protein
MEDYNEFLDMEDADDRRTYDTRYITKLKELTQGVDSEDRDAVIDELQTIKYDPTSNPEQDCELNYLRGQNQRKRKQHQFSKSEESFLQFQAQESGKSVAQVKREARKFLKGVK